MQLQKEMFFDFDMDSSSESSEDVSDMFDSDVYLLKGEDFNELKEQLEKFGRLEESRGKERTYGRNLRRFKSK
jgi:hypothetical protein